MPWTVMLQIGVMLRTGGWCNAVDIWGREDPQGWGEAPEQDASDGGDA